jgi:hypothetical protein
VPGAAYHRATQTLNIPVARIVGAEPPARVDGVLLDAAGFERPSVSIAG